jgi:serine/threonine protein kinase
MSIEVLSSRILELEEEQTRQSRRICYLESKVQRLKATVASLERSRSVFETNYASLLSLFRSIETQLPSILPISPPPFDAREFLLSLQRRFADFKQKAWWGYDSRMVDQFSEKEFVVEYCHHKDKFVRLVAFPLIANLPGILPTVAFCTDRNNFRLVTEFFPNGNLKEAVTKWQNDDPPVGFGSTQLTKCIFGIAFTMTALHSRGIIHRNLKLSSIFLDSHFEPVIGDGDYAMIDSELRDDGDNSYPSGDTLLCMAPERLNEDHYDASVDVYSFGVLICRLFDDQEWGRSNPAPIIFRVLSRDRLPRPAKMPDAVWKFVNRCWHHGPVQRPTFAQIVNELNERENIAFPGTDFAVYREYRERLLRERPNDPRPSELIETLSELIELNGEMD